MEILEETRTRIDEFVDQFTASVQIDKDTIAILRDLLLDEFGSELSHYYYQISIEEEPNDESYDTGEY